MDNRASGRASSAMPTAVTISSAQSSLMAICCLAIILALTLGVGLATGLVLRHLVQTLPLWVAVVLGFGRSSSAPWMAAPCFIFWLILMVLIWTSLLGISHVVNGTFKPIEVVMTIIVGVASLAGLVGVVRSKLCLSNRAKAGFFVLFAALQYLCFWLSFLPAIAHR